MKELKIKEGAENLKKATSDRRSLANVNTMVKKANNKLFDLQQVIILFSIPGFNKELEFLVVPTVQVMSTLFMVQVNFGLRSPQSEASD